jgi:hypothetical protein
MEELPMPKGGTHTTYENLTNDQKKELEKLIEENTSYKGLQKFNLQRLFLQSYIGRKSSKDKKFYDIEGLYASEEKTGGPTKWNNKFGLRITPTKIKNLKITSGLEFDIDAKTVKGRIIITLTSK